MTDNSGGASAPNISAPANDNTQTDADISSSLNRLSLDTSSTLAPKTSDSPDGRRSALNGQRSAPSSRRASAIAADRPPSSPRLNRKSSSSALNPSRQQQGTPPRPGVRRSSSALFSPKSPKMSNSPYTEPIKEVPQVTAASVAADHFKKELELHENAASETTIFIHDSCYGHRYSRPKTPKSTLSLIVERPERLRAGMLGVSSAYVRIGGRHAADSHPIRPNIEPSHQLPFRVSRSSRFFPLTSTAVTNVHGTRWMQELKTMCDSAQARLANGEKELKRPDTPNSSGTSKPKFHEGDLYLCKESLDALQGALGGVIDAVDAVFQEQTKRAFVCIRPPGHHCSADMPSGFCWLNNVHVGIEHAALAHGLTHAAIIDFDLHHGDGSQTITWDRNAKAAKAAKNAPVAKKMTIGYFSLHDINSYPCEYGDVTKVQGASLCIENAHNQTIWNVHLQPWRTEQEFWQLYESRYLVLLEKAREFLRQQTARFKAFPNVRPKGAIFLSAGFDASEYEGQGMQRHKVNVPTDFYARFTQDVRRLADEDGTGVDGRVISVLEGGYSDRALTSGIFSHVSGLVGEISQPIQSSWWKAPMLDELEALFAPAQPAAPPKRQPRSSEAPTYQTPTQSFTAKVVDPTKLYRTPSGTLQTPPRSPTPPPPDVEWPVAAFELSKLLIPADRPTVSCRHDELNEPRVPKQERHSIGASAAEPSAPAEKRMQLRGRKAKAPGDEMSLNVTKSNRRVTLGDVGSLPQSADPFEDAKTPTEDSIASNNTSRSSSKGRLPARATHMRRQSASKQELQGVAEKAAPPLPSVPDQFKSEAADATEAAVVPPSTDVDQLTSGFRKIKLTMGGKPAPAPPASAVSKPAKKPTAPKAKPTTAKAASSKVPTAAVGSQTTAASKATSQPVPPLAAPNNAPVSDTILAQAQQPQSTIPLSDHAQTETSAESQLTAKQGIGYIPQTQMTPTTPVFDGGVVHGLVDRLETGPQPSSIQQTVDGATSQYKIPPATIHAQAQPTTTHVPAHVTSTPPQTDSSTQFIPYIPPEQPHANGKIEQQPLQWLPPNTATPVQTPIKRSKEDLPQFSAVGHIPFATQKPKADGNASTDNVQGETKQGNGSIWDIPNTPAK